MSKKYKVGYTTGVFDLFHIGHLNILKRAKEQCEYLIVGVSTDELVQDYKHKKPVIPFKERMAIVNAIKYVDKTVAQTSMDKIAAWEKLQFDALFHGDDWANTKMYNDIQNELKKHNVAMVFLPHTAGVSSTMILSKMRSAND